MHATIAAFINDARMVTPDIALQRQQCFASMRISTPVIGHGKNERMAERHRRQQPFPAAERSQPHRNHLVLPQTPDTWQVDWTETIRTARHPAGCLPHAGAGHRYTVPQTPAPPKKDPQQTAGIYVREISWSKQI